MRVCAYTYIYMYIYHYFTRTIPTCSSLVHTRTQYLYTTTERAQEMCKHLLIGIGHEGEIFVAVHVQRIVVGWGVRSVVDCK
jgi:hypothetical protein